VRGVVGGGDQTVGQQQIELLLRALTAHAHALAQLRRGLRFGGVCQRAEHLPARRGQPQIGGKTVAPREQ